MDRFQPDAMAAGYEAVQVRPTTAEPEPPAPSANRADKQDTAAAKDLPSVAWGPCLRGYSTAGVWRHTRPLLGD